MEARVSRIFQNILTRRPASTGIFFALYIYEKFLMKLMEIWLSRETQVFDAKRWRYESMSTPFLLLIKLAELV